MQVYEFDNENNTFARLCSDRLYKNIVCETRYDRLSKSGFLSTKQMRQLFTVLDALNECCCHEREACATHVLLVQDRQERKSVLKIFTLDEAEQRHISSIQQEAVTSGRQLRHACWAELNVLRFARQLLAVGATPCLTFLYTAFLASGNPIWNLFERCNNLPEREARLVICTEFLSRMTLRRWLLYHIVNYRRRYDVSDTFLSHQFSLLFFHLFAALHCLALRGGILHNDLHLDNILMVYSQETASHFVYQLGDNHYLLRNNLGNALSQLPIICDFGAATLEKVDDGIDKNMLYDYYCNTQRCAYHNSVQSNHKKCYQKPFCDVTLLLNETHDQLSRYCDASVTKEQESSIMCAFEPFNQLRMRLNTSRQTRCSQQLHSLLQLIEQTFGAHRVSMQTASTFRAAVYNCNLANSPLK